MSLTSTKIKPFLKWAGGKAQLIEQIATQLPDELKHGIIHRYVEPFIGGGALFFNIAQMYEVEEFFISDVNEELILAYKIIQKDVENLIILLKEMERKYHHLTVNRQKEYFYAVRFQLNENRPSIDFNNFQEAWIERTAQIIFLNRTCFNGLFRVNSKGEFNVPFGKYTNPSICNEENLMAVAELLQRTEIRLGDFTECEPFINSNTFVYFDPPYRPHIYFYSYN
jgi:DNA adenine methylase